MISNTSNQDLDRRRHDRTVTRTMRNGSTKLLLKHTTSTPNYRSYRYTAHNNTDDTERQGRNHHHGRSNMNRRRIPLLLLLRRLLLPLLRRVYPYLGTYQLRTLLLLLLLYNTSRLLFVSWQLNRNDRDSFQYLSAMMMVPQMETPHTNTTTDSVFAQHRLRDAQSISTFDLTNQFNKPSIEPKRNDAARKSVTSSIVTAIQDFFNCWSGHQRTIRSYQSDEIHGIAQQTIRYRRRHPYRNTTDGPPHQSIVPVRSYTPQQLQHFTAGSFFDATTTESNETTWTEYERKFRMKQLAYSSLLPPLPDNRSHFSHDHHHHHDNMATGTAPFTTKLVELSSSMMFVDAPLHCWRIHSDVVITNPDPSESRSEKPTIVVITSTQSTTTPPTTAVASLLFKHLIRTMLTTVSASEKYNWNIALYVAIDHTDTWWIHHFPDLQRYIPEWLSVNMCAYPKSRSHHIPFNEVAMTAYREIDPDYYVRVNDDTEFQTSQWISIGVRALQRYDPPNVGVVGPSCAQGNTAILTHDMVHRTHLEIFRGFYYPPSFHNWFLDDWITNIYSSTVLGRHFHRRKVVTGWKIRHMMYTTRYKPDYISAQWLPVEYERGRSFIQHYLYRTFPNHTISQNQLIADTLSLPTQYDVSTIQEILNVLPPPQRNNMNILIWGLNFDSHYWHRMSPYGQVVFLEDKDSRKTFDQQGMWRDLVMKTFPYLQYFPVGYTTTRDDLLDNYDTYVMGQNSYTEYNWCDLHIANFPEVVLNTTWDIIIVDAPERCVTTVDSCSDESGPSILQPLYMTKLLVANQQTTNGNGNPIHVYVDDYDRTLEREFTSRLFMNKNIPNENAPNRILERRVGSNAKEIVQVAHFIFNRTIADDNHRVVLPQCGAPLLRDPDYYPARGELGTKVVKGIVEVLPRKMGNLLIWGIGPDCMFWQQSTRGRVIFLVDANKDPIEINSRKVEPVNYYKALHPELEIYEVKYTSENTTDFAAKYYEQPKLWPSLAMNEAEHRLPTIVTEIAWDVIVVNDLLGCCNSGPGRLQSLYTTKVLAESSIRKMMKPHERESAATHVFVNDYERKLEKDFSYRFYGKLPSSVYRKSKTMSTSQFRLTATDFAITETLKAAEYSYHSKRDMKKLKKMYFDSNSLVTIEWNQVCEILHVLPLNGNLLIWGDTDDVSFWSTVTSGTVVFLSSSNDSRKSGTNVYVYNVNHTIMDTDETYKLYFDRPDLWYMLEMKDKFQPVVLQTNWDVIFIDAPGTIDNGLGKYQSLYTTKAFVQRSEAIVHAEERVHARDHTIASESTPDHTVHVFVDDYESKMEHQYSRQFFERDPIAVHYKHNATLTYAHFAFGRRYNKIEMLWGTNKYMSNVVRHKGAVPKETQMGWDQIRTILANLPTDGNLLVWGLGHDSRFWSRTTTGNVVFLEDGSFGTNLVNGKRWYDLVMEKFPDLEAYAINYTTTNTEEEFSRFMSDRALWALELNITSTFPTSVLKTRWDVIIVDAPLGYPGTGPGRYQSLFMTRLLAEQNEFTNNAITHVFVDDYERKVEREFSQKVFDRSPVEVIGRKKRDNVPANEQAHFVFGAVPSTQIHYESSDLIHSKLIPWSGASYSSPDHFWDSFIVLVEVNDGYFNFFLNWLYHYEALKIGIDVLVVAEDDIVKKKIEREVTPSRRFVHVERSNRKYMAASVDYGTTNYKKLVSGRATHIISRLKAGQNVIYTDVDTVWRLNPLPYLSALNGRADAVLQVDTETYEGVSPYYCTGFMAFVSNNRTIELMLAWENALQSTQLDQPIFNRILHKSSFVFHQPLPILEFPSGQVYFSKMNHIQRQSAVVVHDNYIQGIQNKQVRFEQHDLWRLNDQSPKKGNTAGNTSSWFKFIFP